MNAVNTGVNTELLPGTLPELAEEVIKTAGYQPGWAFKVSRLVAGWFMEIKIHTYNNFHPETGPDYEIWHRFAIPPMVDWTREAWEWWIKEQMMLVMRHEVCEGLTFQSSDGSLRRPYMPKHGLGDYFYATERQGAE